MTETTDTLNSATNTPPDLRAPQPQPAAPEVLPAEPPPAWAMELQANLTALQEQVAQWQAKPPAWFEQAVAALPKRLAGRVNLPTQLRQLEQRSRKLCDAQTRDIVSFITRAVTASGKGLTAQVGKQLKDLERRLKGVEKTLGQMQRKMKK